MPYQIIKPEHTSRSLIFSLRVSETCRHTGARRTPRPRTPLTEFPVAYTIPP